VARSCSTRSSRPAQEYRSTWAAVFTSRLPAYHRALALANRRYKACPGRDGISSGLQAHPATPLPLFVRNGQIETLVGLSLSIVAPDVDHPAQARFCTFNRPNRPTFIPPPHLEQGKLVMLWHAPGQWTSYKWSMGDPWRRTGRHALLRSGCCSATFSIRL
jgi:hypothetical protein